MSSIDTINVCKLKMRTETPCGRRLLSGEKFCNLCSAHKQHLKDLRLKKERNFRSKHAPMDLSLVVDILKTIKQ